MQHFCEAIRHRRTASLWNINVIISFSRIRDEAILFKILICIWTRLTFSHYLPHFLPHTISATCIQPINHNITPLIFCQNIGLEDS